MLARSAVRKVPACLKPRNVPTSRTKATNRAPINQIIVKHSEIANGSLKRKAPACGWRKKIVSTSSSSSSPSFSSVVDDDAAGTNTNTPDEISIGKERFEKLEVDMEELQKLAAMRCTPLSLADMYKYAVDFSNQEQRLRNAQFLHKELPIRIAQRAVDLLTLPHGLSDAHPVQQIAHMYLSYLQKFQEFPVPMTPEEEHEFTDLLQKIVVNRSSIPKAIARGVDVWRKNHGPAELQVVRLQQMEEALYRFFTARVGLRFLIEHHILTSPHHASRSLLQKSHPSMSENEDMFGCIQTDCDTIREIKNVVETITILTQDLFGICPEIQVVDATQGEHDSKFTYVPHHLQYMVGELLKNSCRATVKRYLESEANGETIQMPQIRVVVVKGKEDVTIKVADRGGGIPRSQMSNILRFAQSFSTEDDNKGSVLDFDSDDEVTGTTNLRGFGLPLARIYARYFGGELTLKSMEGYGLDAYLQLPRLGDSCENLPLPVKFSPGELNSNPPRRVGGAL